jgi:hypothetical protein
MKMQVVLTPRSSSSNSLLRAQIYQSGQPGGCCYPTSAIAII